VAIPASSFWATIPKKKTKKKDAKQRSGESHPDKKELNNMATNFSHVLPPTWKTAVKSWLHDDVCIRCFPLAVCKWLTAILLFVSRRPLSMSVVSSSAVRFSSVAESYYAMLLTRCYYFRAPSNSPKLRKARGGMALRQDVWRARRCPILPGRLRRIGMHSRVAS
jgi:hypothetical protein